MPFDEIINKQIQGKYLLIGISYIDAEGKLESQQQLHGTVERSSRDEGIIVQLKGFFKGEKVQLPPDTSSIKPAEPGIYKLITTNEDVKNPDFVCAFEVHKGELPEKNPISS